MNLTTSITSLTRLKRYARSFTVAVSTWCLVCSPCSASADASPDYSQDLADLQTVLELINQQLANIYNPLGPPVSQQQFDGRMDSLLSLVAIIATNRPSSSVDVLAGNPWWATNSAFALTAYNYSRVYPHEMPNSSGTFSFPQFLSKWSSFLTVPAASAGPASSSSIASLWFNRYFGFVRSSSYDQQNPYTWFDWTADAMRSNIVLLSSLGGTTDAPSNAVPDVAYAVDDGSTSGTNGVPDMVVQKMHVTGIEDGLDLVDADAVGDMLPSSFTGSEPRFLVFSGGRYGAVTVPVVAGSLEIPDNVARYLRGVATWLWRVALFVGCFVILRQEVAFWSTLGGSTSDA